MLVDVEDNLALAGLERHRNDAGLERPSAIACAARSCDGRKSILFLAADLPTWLPWFSPSCPYARHRTDRSVQRPSCRASWCRPCAPLRITGEKYRRRHHLNAPRQADLGIAESMAWASADDGCMAEPHNRLQAITVDSMAIPAFTVKRRGT